MWCVRSISADELHPDDVRGRFIRYCQNPALVDDAAGEVEDRFDSDFERDVYRHLIARGYRVKVQHRVGRFRIDLVVEGRRGRLAVELDGDAYHGPDRWEADRNRQAILERLGWTFHRIRGSAYYRDPDAALAGLWDRLEALGIRPVGEPDPAPPAEAADPEPAYVPRHDTEYQAAPPTAGPISFTFTADRSQEQAEEAAGSSAASHCAKDSRFPGVTTPARQGQSTPGFPPWLSTGPGRLIRFPTCTPRLSGASSRESSISSPAKVRS